MHKLIQGTYTHKQPGLEIKHLIYVLIFWFGMFFGIMIGNTIRAHAETLTIYSAPQTSAPLCAGPCMEDK